MLHIIKDFINKTFSFKDKKINKPKLTLVINKTDNQEGKSENTYFSYHEEHFTFEEDISEEYRNELKNHLIESLENKVHPWDFEKNLDFKLKEPDKIYYLFMYYLMYIDIFEQDLFNKYTKLWYENNLDDTTKSDEEINNAALRLLKYDTLGFKLINGSKEEKDGESIKELEGFADNYWLEAKSDNLLLLLKAWKACQEKFLLEDKEKLKVH
jgi:hypothetical protein